MNGIGRVVGGAGWGGGGGLVGNIRHLLKILKTLTEDYRVGQ